MRNLTLSLVVLLVPLCIGCESVPIETIQITDSAIQELKLHRRDDLRALDQLEDALKTIADLEFFKNRQQALAELDTSLPVSEVVAEVLIISDGQVQALYDKYAAVETKIKAYRNSPTLAAAFRDLGAVNEQLRQLNEVDMQDFLIDLQGQVLDILTEVQALTTEIRRQ